MKLLILHSVLFFTLALGAQETEQKTTILWDTSFSMLDRDLQEEVNYLNTYFNRVQNAEVSLLMFNNGVVDKESLHVASGDWSTIHNKLTEVIYDGGTSFKNLSNYVHSGDILLFTDGAQNLNNDTPIFNGNVYIINSNKDINKANINLLTILNKGNYVNLIGIGDAPLEKSTRNYTGTIFENNIGVGGVIISIKGKESTTIRSKENGFYEIEAHPGAVLVFSMNNSIRKEIVLGNITSIDAWFDSQGVRLDEVVVTEKKKALEDKKITAFGLANPDAVGYAVQSITDVDIPESSTNVSNAVQGKFSGVKLGQNDDLSQVVMRPSNSILGNNYGLIVLNGVPMPRSNSSSTSFKIEGTGYIDPKNIASITVLKGLAATNKYGSLGSNGVILITTKTASFDDVKEKEDLALVKNNIYKGKIKISNKLLVTPYLKELKKGKNVEEAYKIYLGQRAQYWEHPEYFIDVHDFFAGTNGALAHQILSNILEKSSPSILELKGLLFKASQNGYHEMELYGAKKIMDLFPNKIQSYLDLALSHKKVGNYQDALNMLIKIDNGSINPTLDFSGLHKIVNSEIRNIIYKKRIDLDLTKVEDKYLNNATYDVRIVFDWNNDQAEFELQFVNPQKKFFKWEHTDLAIRQRIKDELDNGYSKEQFEIMGELGKGEWIINIKYLGNRNPNKKDVTFIKGMVQYNFGKPNQRSEKYMVRLDEKGTEALFFKLNL
ncbi:MAG: hypothetical protein COA50_13270 [Flavobacteriaceae bacterium]|nr:MAG: hypothetical protein COA50_13270 [Flavobacteriaceae bacterium]